MKRALAALATIAIVALGVGVASASAANPELALGGAEGFAVLAATTVTNTGPTIVSGDDLGVSPGTSVTGFPPGMVLGTIHAGDAAAAQAQTGLASAATTASAIPCDTFLPPNVGGLTLTPGVYCFTANAQLTGTLTLDHQGDPNAFFLFRVLTTLTTANASHVVVINAGDETCAPNTSWLVGTSATLGSSSTFTGDLLARLSVTASTTADTTGRLLAGSGQVTTNANGVSVCPTPPAADLSVTASGAPDPVAPGDAVRYAIDATNGGPAAADAPTLDATLPGDLRFQSLTAPAGWTCTTPAVGASGAVSCSAASFAAGPAAFSLAAQVASDVAADETLSVPVAVSSTTPDPDDTNQATSVDTHVVLPAPAIPPVVAPPTSPVVATPPAAAPARACSSVRRFTVHLAAVPHVARGARVVKANLVSAAGRQLRKLLVTPTTVAVDLRGLAKGRVTARITTRLRSGRTAVLSRRYQTCAVPARSAS